MTPNKQIEGVVARALKEVGFKEGENNDSKYGTWAGYPHQSWCAAYVSWVFSCEKILPLIGETQKGYINCASFDNWARGQKLLVPVNQAQRGDILLFCWDRSGVPEHTGIALGGFDIHSHVIPTVEGNTGGDHIGNQSNGDGVYLKFRPISTVHSVVRPRYAV